MQSLYQSYVRKLCWSRKTSWSRWKLLFLELRFSILFSLHDHWIINIHPIYTIFLDVRKKNGFKAGMLNPTVGEVKFHMIFTAQLFAWWTNAIFIPNIMILSTTRLVEHVSIIKRQGRLVCLYEMNFQPLSFDCDTPDLLFVSFEQYRREWFFSREMQKCIRRKFNFNWFRGIAFSLTPTTTSSPDYQRLIARIGQD